MGRTTPPVRMVIEAELERLKRLSEFLHDRELRKALEEIAEGYRDLGPAFKAVPPYDPAYAVLLSGLVRAYKRIDELEKKLESKG